MATTEVNYFSGGGVDIDTLANGMTSVTDSFSATVGKKYLVVHYRTGADRGIESGATTLSYSDLGSAVMVLTCQATSSTIKCKGNANPVGYKQLD